MFATGRPGRATSAYVPECAGRAGIRAGRLASTVADRTPPTPRTAIVSAHGERGGGAGDAHERRRRRAADELQDAEQARGAARDPRVVGERERRRVREDEAEARDDDEQQRDDAPGAAAGRDDDEQADGAERLDPGARIGARPLTSISS